MEVGLPEYFLGHELEGALSNIPDFCGCLAEVVGEDGDEFVVFLEEDNLVPEFPHKLSKMSPTASKL